MLGDERSWRPRSDGLHVLSDRDSQTNEWEEALANGGRTGAFIGVEWQESGDAPLIEMIFNLRLPNLSNAALRLSSG